MGRLTSNYVPSLVEISSAVSSVKRGQTDRQTDRQTQIVAERIGVLNWTPWTHTSSSMIAVEVKSLYFTVLLQRRIQALRKLGDLYSNKCKKTVVL